MFNEDNQVVLEQLPVLMLRGLVLFPNMTLHIDIGRRKSIAAIQAALKANKEIFVVTQKNYEDDSPGLSGLSPVGVIATIRQVVSSPEKGPLHIVVEGFSRARIDSVVSDKSYLYCNIEEIYPLADTGYSGKYETALIRETRTRFSKYAEVQKDCERVLGNLQSFTRAGELADFVAFNINLDYKSQQELLEILNPVDRLAKLCTLLESETELLELENQIQERMRVNIDENQREYYLKERLRAVSEELNGEDSPSSEVQEYKDKIKSLNFSEEVEKKLCKEADKLLKMGFGSQEAFVIKNYLDTVLDLPWHIYSEDNLDIEKAAQVLDADHYGLEDVKQRILEVIAVRQFNPNITGQIICLVGPPGVGKTSIARSLASALGRKYVRVALGGVGDEAEIRGHRKTYIGAMNGRIISAISEAGTSNPLMLLDEIDKLSKDYKGDPSSALLEVLDAEQNSTFKDHFLDIPFDLSKVLFITTANTASDIPAPLFDRMEVIEVPSYTATEKFHIARKHLVKKEIARHGLSAKQVKVTDGAIRDIITYYTAEAGVRELQRTIATLVRKAAFELAKGKVESISFSKNNLETYLGVPKFKADKLLPADTVGVVNGLAWTSVGGTVLQVEASVVKGTGKLILTGSLGDVMKESATAAVSYIRSVADKYGIDPNFSKDCDIHLHFPAGATPKDGPSAGVTIATALISALTGTPVKRKVAMTGEISLKGRVLPIGGLREKTMGAYTAGVTTVVIPVDNEPDLQEVNSEVKDKLTFVSASVLEDVFEVALTEPVKPARGKVALNHIYHSHSEGSTVEVIN